MANIFISPSPHIHSKTSVETLMRDVLIALTPVVLVSFVFAGWSAIRIFAVSVVGCVGLEYIIQRFLFKRPSTISDFSATITGVLLALNMPATAPWWMVLIGCVVAIGIAKMTFGGLGNNLFNPALVARVVLLVSFPVQMTNWSVVKGFLPQTVDSVTTATPLGIIKQGLMQGHTVEEIMVNFGYDFSYWQMLFGRIDGSLGEVSAIAILIGLAYMLIRKTIKPVMPVTILVTVFCFSGILHLINPERFVDPLFHLLSGGLLLGAVFMATDYVTSPMSVKGKFIYAIGIGLLTVIIREWGAYPEGVSFAILIMNAFTPIINKLSHPQHYGEEVFYV